MTGGLWNTPGIPHKGWTCVDILDAGDMSETCQMCKNEKVRYLHVMRHQTHQELKVGCVCAGKMTGDYEAAKKREKPLRNRAARLRKWMTCQWYRFSWFDHPAATLQHINSLYIVRKGFYIIVAQQTPDITWKGWIADDSLITLYFIKDLPTLEAAKRKMFDVYEEGSWKPKKQFCWY